MTTRPQPKIAAAGFAGAVSTLIVWALSTRGVTVPGEVGAAIGTIVSFAAGYLKA